MTDVFLSYKAEDRARLAPLVHALETDGLSVWWDAHIVGGDQWRETIERHLTSARCVIVAWSKRSVGPNGEFVRDEAARAQRLGTYLPVRIDNVTPPLGFGETQALLLHGWKGDRADPRYQAVLGAVRDRLGISSRSSTPMHKAPGTQRRTLLVGGSAVAALTAGLGWWFRPADTRADSIAVLPFANLSGDPQQAYFSDGIAEELRSALSRIAHLKVVARTSSEAVRDADAKTAADRLGVEHILTGSVRKTREAIRISAQLVNGRDGLEQWSQVYDRPVGDALKIQSDIAERVAHALSFALGTSPANFRAQGGTESWEAQDLLIRSNEIRRHSDREQDFRNALELANSALAIDPTYGDAMAMRASLLNYLAGTFARSTAEAQSLFRASEAAALQAIRLAPKSRRGYWALGNNYYYRLRPAAAMQQYAKMKGLPGADPESLTGYAYALSETGKFAEALELVDETISLDPLNPQGFHAKAVILSDARRYQEAEAYARRAIALGPQRFTPKSRLALILILSGQPDKARPILEELPADSWGRLTYEAILNARTGNSAAAAKGLAELRQMSADAGLYQQAQILAQMGDRVAALDALDKAWTLRDPGLTGMRSDPLLDPISSDPRFAALADRLNA